MATALALFLSYFAFAGPPPSPSPSPSFMVDALFKPSVLEKVMKDRDVYSRATLGDEEGDGRRPYHFQGAMLVHEGIRETYRALTQYPQYAKMIQYIHRSDYDPEKKLIFVEGGIFKFLLKSTVHIEERASGSWLHYEIVQGHFTGLTGDIRFESKGEKGTMVVITGDHRSKSWPPAFVVERGAEIVFGFTGKRMRSFVERPK